MGNAVLISGIGRSGTTTMFNMLGQAYLKQYKHAECVYEPYLWNIAGARKTANVKGQPFSTDQLDPYSIYVHTQTPLFLEGRHELHDDWLNRVFQPKQKDDQHASNILCKVIRGSGRLRAILSKFSNLKVVISTRNPVDTINSSLGMFSFFGDEFHPTDRYRFLSYVQDAYKEPASLSSIKNELQWATLWWHYFTLESFSVFNDFPDRVTLVPYEVYVQDKKKHIIDAARFLGIKEEFVDDSLLDNMVGPVTKASYLNVRDIELLNDEIAWYFSKIRELTGEKIFYSSFRHELIKKYRDRPYRNSLLLNGRTNLTAVNLRIELLKSFNVQRAASEKEKIKPLTMEKAFNLFPAIKGSAKVNNADILKSSSRVKEGPSIGVVITCYNNEDSIEHSVLSVLNQTLPAREVIIADDQSSDKTREIVEALAVKYPTIKLLLRDHNIGIAANRDLAIRALNTDLITHLDGDDLFAPEKLEREFRVLRNAGDVSFSNIGLVRQDDNTILDTSYYNNMKGKDVFYALSSRSAPVPRDMLFSKTLFEKSGGFNLDMSIYEDWAFKMRLAAVSNKWRHSSVIGTIYDRREPGLSGKDDIYHAYGQLLSIAANYDLWQLYPDGLKGALKVVNNHLSGELRQRFTEYYNALDDQFQSKHCAHKLKQFWLSASFSDSPELMKEQLFDFARMS